MPNRAITEKQFHQAYTLGFRVIKKKMQLSDAIEILASDYDMGKESAQYYINTLSHMYKGEMYKLTINAKATRYFIESLLKDCDEQIARLALSSLESHIAHRRAVHGDNQIQNSELSSEFRSKLSIETLDAATLDRDLERTSSLARKSTASERKERLESANVKPEEIYVTSRAFRRNPDVIEEALARADGVCGGCKSSAPFIRASGGTPFLEVHHKIPLSEKGLDSIDNAIALCPNCHREAHFGENRKKFR